MSFVSPLQTGKKQWRDFVCRDDSSTVAPALRLCLCAACAVASRDCCCCRSTCLCRCCELFSLYAAALNEVAKLLAAERVALAADGIVA